MDKKILLTLGLLFITISVASYVFFINTGSADKEQSVIMAFGDSLTYGQGDRDEQGYVEKLEKDLNNKYPEKDFKIQNLGVKGRESGGVIKELANPETASKLSGADYFIIFIGTNDFINSNGGNLREIHPEKLNEGREDYLRNLKIILTTLRKANEDAPILVLGLYNPYPESGNEVEPYLDEWNKSTIKVLNEMDRATYIPTNDLFKGKEKNDYFSDSLHLNEQGYELLEERILEEYNFGKFK